jgi:glycosyltransferase involved in cell wall biosynthesis
MRSESKIIERRVGGKVKESPPRVSVVIPAYNAAATIAETLDSVLAQTFTDYEIIVVNDGSPDAAELEKTLAAYFEKIVYIKQTNGGAAAARNAAIENARGEFVAFVDADDIWQPEFLASQMEFLTANNLEMVYADAVFFGAARGGAAETFMQKAPSEGKVDFASLVGFRCNVLTSATVVSRRKVLEVGMFDAELPRACAEDFDLWARLARAGTQIGYQKKVLLKHRVSPSSLSGSSIQRARRNVLTLSRIGEKYELNAAEEKILRETLAEAEAELHLEAGKAHLLREEFAAAREKFRLANRYYQKPKFKLIDLMLTISPKTLVRIFKRQRARELPFIPTSDF